MSGGAAASVVVVPDAKAVAEAGAAAEKAVIPNPDDKRLGDSIKIWTKAVWYTGPDHFKPVAAADQKKSETAGEKKEAASGSGSGSGGVSLASMVGPGGLIDHFPPQSIVLVGFPYDEGCRRNGGRAGSAEGPRVFRQLLKRTGPLRNPEFDIDIRRVVIIDSGDILPAGGVAPGQMTQPPQLEAMHTALEQRVLEILQSQAIPFVVGGSNDQSYPSASALMTYSESSGTGNAISVVNIDAHLDVRPLKDGRVHSGSPFRCLLEDKRFLKSGSSFVEFAAQGNQCSKEHVDYITTEKRQNIVWLTKHLRADQFKATLPTMK